jgi:hypothetical protein
MQVTGSLETRTVSEEALTVGAVLVGITRDTGGEDVETVSRRGAQVGIIDAK